MRRWLVQAVVMAFVLPALVGLLPQPALSASAALDRDIMMSVCGQDLPGKPGGVPQHQATHDHCVLCGSHCSSCSPMLAAVAPAYGATPRHDRRPETAPSHSIASPLQALLYGSPPRGPPAA